MHKKLISLLPQRTTASEVIIAIIYQKITQQSETKTVQVNECALRTSRRDISVVCNMDNKDMRIYIFFYVSFVLSFSELLPYYPI